MLARAAGAVGGCIDGVGIAEIARELFSVVSLALASIWRMGRDVTRPTAERSFPASEITTPP